MGDLQNFIKKGDELNGQGKFKEAIAEYQKALAIDKESGAANYGISSAYFYMNDFNKAIEYSDKVIDARSDMSEAAYILKGSALDILEKPKDAIKLYKKAINKFPNSHLLHFNLGLTYYNQKELEQAESSLENALLINPNHPGSHLLLGYVMDSQRKRVQSVMALYNFLLLEPEGKRANTAVKIVESQLKRGVQRKDAQNMTIMVSPADKKDDFSFVETMMSLLSASLNVGETKDKTADLLFFEFNKSFIGMLSETKKKNKGFWWGFYVDFYTALQNENHLEAFSYYISQSKDDTNVSRWLSENKTAVDALLRFTENYKRNSK